MILDIAEVQRKFEYMWADFAYNWLENVEWYNKIEPPRWLIGEDDNGDIYLPSKTREDWWDRPINFKYPSHWIYFLNSRIRNQCVFLEQP